MQNRLKILSIILVAVVTSFLLDACHSTKKVTTSSESTKTETRTVYRPVEKRTQPEIISPPKNSIKSPDATAAPISESKKESGNSIVTTYAAKLGVSKEDITNYNLYIFIDKWYGTPYKYAGRTKAGIDCSDFAAILLQSVYNVSVSGAVTNIYKQCKPIKPSQLREGDLVFFKIKSRSLSHVGIYLQNHKFVHASVHAGVIIDDLGEVYYKKYFRAAGRIVK